MRCRGFNRQIAAKNSFCGPCPGLCPFIALGGGGALPKARQNGLDRVRMGEICDHSQRAAVNWTDRNIDIKYTLKPLGPVQWRARRSLIVRGFSGGLYCRFL